MSNLGDFDINELILQLHGEMKLAFEIAQSSEKNYGLQIDTIKTRFGRKKGKTANGVSNEDSLEILNGNRYPNEEDWELEVNYKYGLPVPDIPKSQNWVTTYDSQRIIKKLSNTSIINIKGINTIWKNRFEKEQLFTVEDLALTDAFTVQKLCIAYNSLKPLEFQVKILLLVRDFKPLQYDRFAKFKLNTLLYHSINELKLTFNNNLTGPEISELKTMASLLYLVFDRRFTNTLCLDILA